MPKTPEKKRSGNLVASPETAISAASIKQNVDFKKRKKRYQFAPINNLEPRVNDELKVLRSISVSQVRNSTTRNSQQQAQKVIEPKKPDLLPTPRIVAAKENKRYAINKSDTEVNQLDDTPSEKVIWKYSPIEGDLSDKVSSSHENSEDYSELDRYQDPSSTPMVPKRLKSVLSFANTSERDQTNQHDSMSVQIRNSVRSRGTTESLKESMRDIDDILGDMEDGLASGEKSAKRNELPSSPARLQEKQEEAIVGCSSENSSISPGGSSSDDDDSLINLLTQKPSQKQQRAVIGTESDTLDDSLIDYFDSCDKKNPKETVEMEIENVETMLSEGLKMPSRNTKPPSLNHRKAEYIQLASLPNHRKGLVRFVLMSVAEINLPKIGRQKILTCIDGHGEMSSVVVRHPWVYLEFEEGDVIHIIEGQNIENKRLLSDDRNPATQLINDNLLILNPDLLLSATAVGGSIECLRRAVLQSILEDTRGEPSLVMTVGNIVHELLQNALRYKLTHEVITIQYMEEILDTLLQSFTFAILLCNENVENVRSEIRKTHVDNILKFVNQFVKKGNYGCYVSVSGTRKTDPLSITNVIDTEESIWSPMYGLKGFLDVTVEVLCKKNRSVVPLEVKTGKNKSISHEAQGLIYMLLLNDRYEVPLDFYLLLYTRKNDITRYPYVLHSVKHVLMFRNQMATKLKYRLKEGTRNDLFEFSLPPLLQSSYCDSCHFKAPCMVMNSLLEQGNAESSGLKNGEYELLTGHLSPNQAENAKFFKTYNDLITREESSITSISKNLFLTSSKVREAMSGRCLSNLTVAESRMDPARDNCFLHVFVRVKCDDGSNSILHSHLAKNDMVLISDEEGHFAISQGFVADISSKSITISSRRKILNNRVPAAKSNGLPNIRSVVDDSISVSSLMRTQNMVTYRIDKNDIQQGLSLARFSLLNLFLPPAVDGQTVIDEKSNKMRALKRSEGGDERMRAILVDKKPPRFLPDDVPVKLPYGVGNLSNFNCDQIKAVEKVMRAEDYALILGMPGTGKTTVIAEIIKILVSIGKSILLTSYTHSAVDNILLKLKDTDIRISRLGMKHRIHPEIQHYQPDNKNFENYEDYLGEINSTSVVATTCLGINDIMFSMREKDFDYVILDEASQVSMPIALAPLRYGDKFIMVGDHHQLPPLVKNEAARTGGLEESLFKMLCESQPQSVSELTIQYRMCEDIVTLSNFLIYKNKLKCGNAEVRDRSLQIPSWGELRKLRRTQTVQPWLEDILDPNRKVVFLNYDGCGQFFEECDIDNITNKGEVKIVEQCLEGMIHCGVKTRDIGVMTLYRAQLSLLKKTLDKKCYHGLEILTADQFQGRDKECIIISMVRSNAEKNGGSLLKELRRVNVAMTRAKSKLIIVGSKKTIGSIPEIESFVKLLERRDWIYEMPLGFMEAYQLIASSEKCDEQSEANCPSLKSEKTQKRPGAKQLTAGSRLLKDKPIVRQALSEL